MKNQMASKVETTICRGYKGLCRGFPKKGTPIDTSK